MKQASRSRLWLGVLSISVLVALPASAEDWKLDGKLLGELKTGRPVGSLNPDDYKKASDVSGIACDRDEGFPRLCLIVDDESQGTQLLMLGTNGGEAGSFIPLVRDVFQRPDGKMKPLDFDGEAVAYADGAFYVSGSHGRPRHESSKSAKDQAEQNAKAQASRQLFRVIFSPNSVDPSATLTGPAPAIAETARLNEAIAAHAELSDASNAPLAEQGLTIEGIAVRDGQLYAGLRAPVIDDAAFMLAVPLDVLFGDKPLTSRLIKLKLGLDSRGNARGIRDLTPFRDGFLLIAGPAIDPGDGAVAAGDYALFYVVGDQPTPLLDLPAYGKRVKPEALLPLGGTGEQVEALLLFDGANEGGGRIVEFKLP